MSAQEEGTAGAPPPEPQPPEPQSPDLQPIGEALTKAQRRAQAKKQAEDDAAYISGLLRTKGEAHAGRIARAIKMNEAAYRKLVSDWNLEQAKEEQERRARERPPEQDDGDSDGKGGAGSGGGGKSGGSGGGSAGKAWTVDNAPVKPLPEHCPVKPLGRSREKHAFYYLDRKGSFVEVPADRHNANQLRPLFGQDIDWMWKNYPKFNERSGKQSGVMFDRLADSLISASDLCDVFEPTSMVRQDGGWIDDKGGLVLHCGDQIHHSGEWRQPGFHAGKLYPMTARRMRPSAPAANAEEKRAERAMIDAALSHLDSWRWVNDGDSEVILPFAMDVDGSGHKLASILLLSWTAAAKAGGALHHRPTIWITGDTGTGKTTLQEAIDAMIGDSLIRSTNATSAGVWTPLGYSSRPVALDEAENDPGGKRMKDMVELARASTTGGKILRGSQGHQGKEFNAYSAFAFSSIIIPPLNGQDLRRITIFELGPLSGAKPPPQIDLAAVGRVMLRRLMDGWARWSDTYAAYWNALSAAGHDPGGCNQYGTLLTMADLMRFDECADGETIGLLAGGLSALALKSAHGDASNAETMLAYLRSYPLDVFRGGTRMTIGRLVEIAAKIADQMPEGQTVTAMSCADALAAHGVFVDNVGEQARVVIPNQHTGFMAIMRGSDWEGRAGARKQPWTQAMRRLPKAEQVSSSRYEGRGWSIPVRIFLNREKGKK